MLREDSQSPMRPTGRRKGRNLSSSITNASCSVSFAGAANKRSYWSGPLSRDHALPPFPQRTRKGWGAHESSSGAGAINDDSSNYFGGKPALNPPSTIRAVPVMKEASSLARKTAALATSEGSPMRPRACREPASALALAGSGCASK